MTVEHDFELQPQTVVAENATAMVTTCVFPYCQMPPRVVLGRSGTIYCDAHGTKDLRRRALVRLNRSLTCAVADCNRERRERAAGGKGRLPMYCDIHANASRRPRCIAIGCSNVCAVGSDTELASAKNLHMCRKHRSGAPLSCKRCKAPMGVESRSRVCLACRTHQKIVREERRRARSLTIASSPMRAKSIEQARIIAMKKAGWLPMEPFPGADQPWRCANLSCKHIQLVKFKRRRQHACGRCSGRSRNDAPASVYLIAHHELNALKIGWHKRDSDRIESWQRRGWVKIVSYDVDTGRIASACEKDMLIWWRVTLGLGWGVHPDAMGEMHGATETVPLNRVSIDDCITRLLSEIKAFAHVVDKIA